MAQPPIQYLDDEQQVPTDSKPPIEYLDEEPTIRKQIKPRKPGVPITPEQSAAYEQLQTEVETLGRDPNVDPRTAAREVYQKYGRYLTPEAAKEIQSALEYYRNPQNKEPIQFYATPKQVADSEIEVKQPNKGHEPTSIWDVNPVSMLAATQEAAMDVPGRSEEFRKSDLNMAAAELAKVTGKAPATYYQMLPGQQLPIVNDDTFWKDLNQYRRAVDPNFLSEVGSSPTEYRQIQTERFIRDSLVRQDLMSQQGFFGNLVGGVAGAATDPINVLTAPVGGTAKTIGGAALKTGGANALIELGMLPGITLERKAQGRELTPEEAAINVAGSTILGASLGAGARALGGPPAEVPVTPTQIERVPTSPRRKQQGPISADHVVESVGSLTERWENAPAFRVAQNAGDLDKKTRATLKKAGATKAKGFVDKDGRVTILADNIKDETEIASVVFHESLGHKGIRDLFGDELDDFLVNLYETNHLAREATDLWLSGKRNQKLYANTKNPLARAVEEQIARTSEQGEASASIMDAVKRWIREFARKHLGADLRLNDAEVRKIISDAHKTVTEGKKVKTPSGPAEERYMQVGEQAEGVDLEALARAKQLEEQGVSPQQIALMTNWRRAPDGEWRTEISDAKSRVIASRTELENLDPSSYRMQYEADLRRDIRELRRQLEEEKALTAESDQRIKNVEDMIPSALHEVYTKGRVPTADEIVEDFTSRKFFEQPEIREAEMKEAAEVVRRLVEADIENGDINIGLMARDKTRFSDVLEHEELYSRYPELREVPVVNISHAEQQRGTWGWYDEEDNVFGLSSKLTPDQARSVLLHEVQHWTQSKENWARGGTPATAVSQIPAEKLQPLGQRFIDIMDFEAKALKQKADALRPAQQDPDFQEAIKLGSRADKLQRRAEAATSDRTYNELMQRVKRLYEQASAPYHRFLQKLGYRDATELAASPVSSNQMNELLDLFQERPDDVSKEILKTLDLRRQARSARTRAAEAFSPEGQLQRPDHLRAVLNSREDLQHQAYQHLFGEIEARDTEARMDLSEDQRRYQEPYQSEYEIEPEDIIFSRPEGEGTPTSRVASVEEDANRMYMMEEDETVEGFGDPEKSGPINLSNLYGTQDALDYIKQIQEDLPTDVPYTHESIVGLASYMNLSPSKVAKKIPNITPEWAVAARRALVSSAEEVTRLSRKLNDPEVPHTKKDLEKFQMQILRHRTLQEAVSNLASNAGRVLESFRIPVGRDWARTKELLESVDLGQLDSEEFLYALSHSVEEIADNPKAVNDAINQAAKPFWEDYIISGRQALMLSGWKTHVKNSAGNALIAVLDNMEHGLAAIIGHARGRKLRGEEDRVLLREAMIRPAAMFQAMFEGATYKNAALSWKQSHPHHAVSKYEHGRAVFQGPVFGVLQTPYRALATEDSFFRSLIENANLYGLAMRKASAEGRKGSRFADRVEQLRRDPTKEMLAESNRHTAILQLIDEPTKLARALQHLKNVPGKKSKAPELERTVRFAISMFFPFHNVADRLLFTGVRRTPLLSLLDRVTIEDFRAGGARQDLAIARIALGSAFLGSLWAMLGNGMVEISGTPRTFDLQAQEQTTGRRPGMVKVGDQWRSLAGIEQVSIPIIALANIRQQYDRGELTEDGATNAIFKLIPAVGTQMSEQSGLQNIGDFMAMLGEGPIAENARENYWANFANSFYPALFRQYHQTFKDPSIRDHTGRGDTWDKVRGKLQASSPASEGVPQRYDPLGKPIKRQTQGIVGKLGLFEGTTESDNPVAHEINRLSLANDNKVVVAPADRGSIKSLFGEDSDLYAEDVQRFQELSGQEIQDDLEVLFASDEYQALTDEAKFKEAKKVTTKARKRAREMMEEELTSVEPTEGGDLPPIEYIDE